MPTLPDASTLADLVRTREVRATELLDECLERIRDRDTFTAFVHVGEAAARAAAERVDDLVAAGVDPGPFAGVPIGVKDLEDVAGMPTSHGSRLFAGRVAAHDSLHVARLRAAGAVPVGKTAAPELGTFNHTSSTRWGTTRNPWDPTTTPGGSSGGSAAAVTSAMVALATASDGGGSTRSPAAFCGLVGLKPSYGRIPRLGPDVSELAADGALVTTVRDAARHLDVVAGPDPRCRTSLPAPGVRYEATIDRPPAPRPRLRWSPDLGGTATGDPEVVAIAWSAAAALAGALDADLDDEPFRLTAVFGTYLATTRLDAWLAIRDEEWPECASLLEPSTVEALRATEEIALPRWTRAATRRAHLCEKFAEVLSQADVVLSPTTALPAFAADEPSMETVVAATPYTMLANLTGVPAVSVPAGLTTSGLPVGLQIIGPPHGDEIVLRMARVVELTRPWPRHAPGFGGETGPTPDGLRSAP